MKHSLNNLKQYLYTAEYYLFIFVLDGKGHNNFNDYQKRLEHLFIDRINY